MAVIEQKLFIEGPLPGLNDLIACAKVSGRRNGQKNWNAYAAMKKQWGEIIKLTALAQGIKPVTRVWIDYVWIEPNKKRDPDNVCAGGRKLILDGLVHAGVLPGDGWKHIAGHSDSFKCAREDGGGRPGVLVILKEEGERGDPSTHPPTNIPLHWGCFAMNNFIRGALQFAMLKSGNAAVYGRSELFTGKA